MKESTLKKLKKEYTPEMISFRRKWVNLFRENKGRGIQISTLIMFFSFLISIILFVITFNELSCIPFAISFIIMCISLIYFRIFPLTWKEMNDIERSQFRMFYKLPNDWDINNM